MKNLHFKIYNTTKEIPESWEVLAQQNIFLSLRYLRILEQAAPENMQCFFIGIFNNHALIAISLCQFLNAKNLEPYGFLDNKHFSLRNLLFKKWGSQVLFMGNNMLSGENSFVTTPDIPEKEILPCLQKAADAIKKSIEKQGLKVNLTIFKDFKTEHQSWFKDSVWQKCYCFNTQPNMVFHVKPHWKNFDDYVADLSKKYRDQYKRSRKKGETLTKKKLSLDEIKLHEAKIHQLYLNVAKSASFNTFYLPKNHFSVIKSELKQDFLFYGYFDQEELIGFNTLIKHQESMETYFLGYNPMYQKEKMLYLNMLFDMVAYSINKGFKKINFGRTALEIKSGIGAEAEPLHGYMLHSNILINKKLPYLFPKLEPQVVWQKRNPFKTT